MAEPIRPASPSPVSPTRPPDTGARGSVSHTGPDVTVKPPNVVVRDSFSADSGIGAQASGTGPGGVQWDAHASGPQVSINGRGSASVGLEGVDINLRVEVDATLAEAGASAERTFTVEVPGGEKFDITVDLSADGLVGADGKLNINLHIGPNGVSMRAGAQGFAGAQAGLTGEITVRHEGREVISGEATLSATAGVGFNAQANLSFRGGNVDFSAGAQATAGAGLGFEVDGSLNAKNAARAALEVTGSLAPEGVKWAQDRIEDAGQWLGNHASNAGDWVGDRFEDIGGFIDQHNPLPWP